MSEFEKLNSLLGELSGHMPTRVPLSTYRLQLNRDFTLAQAAHAVEYLHGLGITDIYSSPYFTPSEGSTHGYDITDHSMIGPEIGTEDDFRNLTGLLAKNDMGLIMDIVPNHMSIESARNAWWHDVLENGQSSRYAKYFDIDWSPLKEELEDKVILPILGDQYGNTLERRELSLSLERGGFYVSYYSHKMPIDPSTYGMIIGQGIEGLSSQMDPDDLNELLSIITASGHLPSRTEASPEKIEERMREKEVIKKRINTLYENSDGFRRFLDGNLSFLNGQEGIDALDALLVSQAYRLAFWQVATEEINYRRFFDINSLAAIRTEEPEVFRSTHEMLMRHIGEGRITGIRADHPDGLFAPRDYFTRLQQECFLAIIRPRMTDEENDDITDEYLRMLYSSKLPEMPSLANCFYVVCEKILIGDEPFPTGWPVSGTTGYVFLISSNGVFVDSDNEKKMTSAYSLFAGNRTSYDYLVYTKKKQIMEHFMASEVNVLGHMLNRISEGDRHYRDFTLNSLVYAIIEVIAHFPVYRTYIDENEVPERDRQYIAQAIDLAKRYRHDLSPSIFDFLHSVLTLNYPAASTEATRLNWLNFTMKFQQLTAPIMAKGTEDTVFYCYNRLVSLNEVGGSPENFGTRDTEFHAQNLRRASNWPHTLIATSTHDSKRSEDVRARINVLSEIPDEWKKTASEWSSMIKKARKQKGSQDSIDRNDEYMLYQNMLGAWPIESLDCAADEGFKERIRNYMLKASREGKTNTTWINPNTDYERRLLDFIDTAFESNKFMDSFMPFARKVAFYGGFNSLSQVALKATAPGVPDFYQGTEHMNLRLVDPDNRVPVDFDSARDALNSLIERESAMSAGELCKSLVNDMPGGLAKLYLTRRVLMFRKDNRELFLAGQYTPLYATGQYEKNIIAFARTLGNQASITIAPRFLTRMITSSEPPVGGIWADTWLPMQGELAAPAYLNILSGAECKTVMHEGVPSIQLSDALSVFPVALLKPLHHA